MANYQLIACEILRNLKTDLHQDFISICEKSKHKTRIDINQMKIISKDLIITEQKKNNRTVKK